jgi:hypothetical protein
MGKKRKKQSIMPDKPEIRFFTAYTKQQYKVQSVSEN